MWQLVDLCLSTEHTISQPYQHNSHKCVHAWLRRETIFTAQVETTLTVRHLLWVASCLVGNALFSQGLPHFSHHLGDLYGIGAELRGLELMVGNVRASCDALYKVKYKSVCVEFVHIT